MINRVGQVWEFQDGMIIVLVASRPNRNEPRVGLHDAVVLVNSAEDPDPNYAPGTFSPGWREATNWEKHQDERWRIA